MQKYNILNGPEHEKKININGTEITVHRIQALTDIAFVSETGDTVYVKKNDLGGWVEGIHNLNPLTRGWVHDNAIVCQNARVKCNAVVTGNAVVCGNAVIDDSCLVAGNAFVSDNCELFDYSFVTGNAKLTGDTVLQGRVLITDNAVINGTRETNRKGVSKQMLIRGNIFIYGDTELGGASFLNGDIQIFGNTKIEKCYLEGKIDIWDSTLNKLSLNGRYMVSNGKKVCYFEKTRIPRKFLIKNGTVNKINIDNGDKNGSAKEN